MKFAFLVHPLSRESVTMLDLDRDGSLLQMWGLDAMAVAAGLHGAFTSSLARGVQERPLEVSVFDELGRLTSPDGAAAEGRIYEIPLDAYEILGNPDRALEFMQEAVSLATEWGASLIGLGSMTGIVGSRGEFLAEHSPIAVTTGNSLTAYTALQNLYQVAEEFDIDLRDEAVAVVGIPGSIASGVAALVAPHCGRLLLVGRNKGTATVRKFADQVGGEYFSDISDALSQARVVISATSSGNCIDQHQLLPGTIVIDVGVPTDVIGNKALRPDVLILTGGLVKLPDSMSSSSRVIKFHHRVIPSCLGETLALALDQRAENLSLGRRLSLDSIQDIGSRARAHGYDFSRLYSFGNPLDDAITTQFRQVRMRLETGRTRPLRTVDKRISTAADQHARHCNPVLHALGRSSGFVRTFVRGEGVYVYDAEGREYFDCVSGFGSLNLGHNHPAVVEALTDALSEQAPGFVQSAVNPYQGALAADLAALAPSGLEMVFFCNSGTESVEAALKLARILTGRERMLSCEGAYHGKSLGALSVSGTAEFRRPFGPLLAGCETIPLGNSELLERELATRRFAAFIIEPLQAEGGMYVLPEGFLKRASELCRRTDTLLIVDEVQTGLGRTGALFACEHEGVQPDVLCLAKSLGGGLMPIGAMLTRRDLWMQAYGTVQTFALHTSTFGGGSLACAAALATLRVLQHEGLAENAAERGTQLQRGLVSLCRRSRCLKEVRGQGLLIGLEFHPIPANLADHWRASDPTGTASMLIPQYDRLVNGFHVLHALQTLLHGHGIYAQTCRSNPFVLRLQPPLIVTAEQIDSLLMALEQTCEEIDYVTSLVDDLVAKTGIGEHDAAAANSSSSSNGKSTVVLDVPKVFNEELPAIFATNADAARQIGVRFQICVTGDGGGEWFVDVSKSGPSVTKGNPGGADCGITIAVEDFRTLYDNPDTDMVRLYFSGKVQFSGDTKKAGRLRQLFELEEHSSADRLQPVSEA
ncbi:MAG TPA: aminotransferase class III-fold pyridoxal phosphate-dependent enzyme [Planctomycetes bacterium]|nr:aminotransferase class III-fold pyridoxal phosphate-dependent enzyme [Fuerstiella sp.]HIK91356.1 aminotransferase class III-fold pyridoxal phosphate-dependent enzyme [Planctomycetota bacterium]